MSVNADDTFVIVLEHLNVTHNKQDDIYIYICLYIYIYIYNDTNATFQNMKTRIQSFELWESMKWFVKRTINHADIQGSKYMAWIYETCNFRALSMFEYVSGLS